MRRAMFTVTALIVSVFALGVAPAIASSATLKADYRFEGDLKSSVGNGPTLSRDGKAEFKKARVDGSRDGVLAYDKGTCLKLGNATKVLGAGGGRYTIAMQVKLDNVTGYRKLIDFDNLQDDSGLYVNDGSLYPYDLDSSDDGLVKENRWSQIVMTRNERGRVAAYLDGDKVVSVDDPMPTQSLGTDEILNFLCDDKNQGTEDSGGAIARLRIFDDALGAKKVRGL